MSLRKKYVKNSFLNVSGWLWLAIVNVVTTPYIFHKLGYDQYGILSLVLTVLGYFAFLDFGLGDAVIKFVAHYNTLKDYRKINRIISSIFLLYLAIGIVGGVLIFLFAKYFALNLFKVPLEFQSKSLYCFYIGAFGFSLNLVFAVISKIPEAIQRFDISNVVNVCIGSFVTFANVTILFLGYGLQELVVVNLMSTFVGIITFYVIIKKALPDFKIFIYFSLEEMREVFSYGLYTLFTKFSSIISQSINQLIIGVVLGPAGIGVINIPSKLVSRFTTLVSRIAYIVFPLTSELCALNDLTKIKSIYLKLSRYVYIISSLFFLILIAYSKSILYFWMGNDFAQKAYLPMVIITISMYLVTATMIPSLIAIGMTKPKYNALFSFIGAATNAIFIYPLTKYYGLTGSALSVLLGSFNSPFFIFFFNKKILNINNYTYFFNAFTKVTIMNLGFLILFSLFQRFIIQNIFSFCLVLFLSEIMMIGLFYLYGLYNEDRQAVKLKLIGVIAKRRIRSL
ncbi:MAG: hypothetical protein DCC43_00865 [Candidatus Brocadia sp.]|jgi:Membrane protein involved in the export of O-antigen and teichoic acid|uniref:Polysaccharide biosynthesis protein n=1 Tax=Candidatus Brocadia fulgida TaxID=380242 RepID=A0A0M2UZ18_9BACT|nr:MAG: putative polysaccharide biosynthesis protein [Candidatus Brocadia fulgida]MCC6326669.1 oligosaccharide flippase family protein [Candidatus Brocadia sp.]MCE7910253.1 hypothetical protein [Candidatus Brocadia sp. AMX3]MBV6518298.1 hypothetical protein [Candidatus Brocadia fulgida]MDG5997060.1 hypothetical protein [Candidatus Brocadia sp.]